MSNCLNPVQAFTVRIKRKEDDAVLGTGIIVSSSGHIVTCYHVIRCVLDNESCSNVVRVDFPHWETNEEIDARIVHYLPDYDDDVALLKLKELPEIDPDDIARLATAANSEGHKFVTYGFPVLGEFDKGQTANGKISEYTLPAKNRQYLANYIRINSPDIDRGMSGGAVFDKASKYVVGVIAKKYNAAESNRNRYANWAVDCLVLCYDPFAMEVRGIPPALGTNIRKKRQEAIARRKKVVKNCMGNAPELEVGKLVRRGNELRHIELDFNNKKTKITGLVGEHNQGKTSIARKWCYDLNKKGLSADYPIFWWDFDGESNSDLFFENFLHCLCHHFEPSRYTSSIAKARLAAEMLLSGSYVVVLDGIDNIKDEKGFITDPAMGDFLHNFANPVHESYCLITSNSQMLELRNCPSYKERKIKGISSNKGRAVYEGSKIRGSKNDVDKLVSNSEEPPLAYSVMAALVNYLHDGDASAAPEIKPEKQTIKVILNRFDKELPTEKALLTILSAFRQPVKRSDLIEIARLQKDFSSSEVSLDELSDREFGKIINRLSDLMIINKSKEGKANVYSLKGPIGKHYSGLLKKMPAGKQNELHNSIKNHYIETYRELKIPTLESITPPIEAVHHACAAKEYNDGTVVFKDYLADLLTHILSAYPTELDLLAEFFPKKNFNGEPLASAKGSILASTAVCLNNTGNAKKAMILLDQALDLYKRKDSEWESEWDIRGIQARAFINLGHLDQARETIDNALDKFNKHINAKGGRNTFDTKRTLAWLKAIKAWCAHLQGDMETASVLFKEAENIQKRVNPELQCLWSWHGVHYAEHLYRTGEADICQDYTEKMLKQSDKHHNPSEKCICQRILGDIEADAGNNNNARKIYDEAINTAENESGTLDYFSAILSKGLWAARTGKAKTNKMDKALMDLDRALAYFESIKFKLRETDTRVGYAWAYLNSNEQAMARKQIDKVKTTSSELDYYWGGADATVVEAFLE